MNSNCVHMMLLKSFLKCFFFVLRYFICHGGNPELHICAPRTHWNQERQRCERPEDAECEVKFQ